MTFLGHVVDGTLGNQCKSGDPSGPSVASRLVDVMPHTLALAVWGMLVAAILALPLGVVAAIRRGTWIDTLATTISLTGISIPQMLFAPLLILWGFITLGWFPGPTELGARAVILPALAVGTHLMAMLARMTRSSMVEVLGEDYVRTARAKGLPERQVLMMHALRNALLPVITIAGLQFGSLLSGAIIIENVFSRPGLGSTLIDAIRERNYPVVQGSVLVIAAIYVVVNMAVDLAYGPRRPEDPPPVTRTPTPTPRANPRKLSPSGWIGLVMLSVYLVIGIIGPWIAPYDLSVPRVDLGHQFEPGSAAHWLGTDATGRDTLSQLLWGTRSALELSLIVVALSSALGLAVGTVAGWFGGAVDEVVMRVVDILMAFPRHPAQHCNRGHGRAARRAAHHRRTVARMAGSDMPASRAARCWRCASATTSLRRPRSGRPTVASCGST